MDTMHRSVAAPTFDREIAVGDPRVPGVTLLVGFVVTVLGSVLVVGASGNLFAAMEEHESSVITGHLVDVADARTRIVVGLALWMVGIPTIAAAAALTAQRGALGTAATIARWAAAAGTGALLVFFALMMGITVGLAPAAAAGQDVVAVARALGVAADTADQFTTTVLLGIALPAAALAGRSSWAPRWLVRTSVVAIVAGVLMLALVALGAYEVAMAPFALMLLHVPAVVVALLRAAG